MTPHLLDRTAACEFFGGTRPLNPATLYRGIRKGRYPRPVKVGPGSSRCKRSPRGPARALLKLIEQAPEAAFAALGGKSR
jgi:predicted DNA-binding transcriptional regulator AlpA